jgi:hypothetical protein
LYILKKRIILPKIIATATTQICPPAAEGVAGTYYIRIRSQESKKNEKKREWHAGGGCLSTGAYQVDLLEKGQQR